ncbi:MAG: AraC family transcriptional regulator [Verrucomicrobia bacterium]|nr:AraC family transcriptional regulator [Verrucomicrobiota bacterium]
MPVPETTSAEALHRYAVGRTIAASRGPAWRDVQLSVLALPPVAEIFTMPAVTEPFIAWTTAGEAETQERENGGPWLTSRVKKGSMFLTAAGAPYDFRYRTLTPEPYEVVLVLLSVPLFEEALAEVFGANAPSARLRDVSGFEDPHLVALLQALKYEVVRPAASRLYVRGFGQAIAVHLARQYTALTEDVRGETSGLPGFKLRRITDWMAEHLAEEFCLARLAEQAGMSEFHFNRLFKRATGVPPSQYQIRLRLDTARRLLRETKKSVITVANDVGYSNPSHFAQLFRKETGLSPTDYRRQR